jgi:hypothetical protein
METQNFVANGNPRPLLRIDPAQTLGKIEVARKLGSECIVGKQEVIRFLSVCPLLKRKRDEACYRCTMPGFGLGQVEMSIASMSDRPRQPDWNGNKKER